MMERLIDANRLLSFIEYDAKIIVPEKHTAQDIIMMIKTAPTIKTPPNHPLNLEELGAMDMEPVWFVDRRIGVEGWRLLKVCAAEVFEFCGITGVKPARRGLCDYRADWVACRKKPEEGMP